jgi:hypothetical protein
MFFTLYKYIDIYIVVYDWTGNLYDNLKECDDEIITYLFKNIKIYDNLSDINISENTYLSEEFNHFLKNNY